MTSDPRAQQDKEWIALHGAIEETLRQFGEADNGGEQRDYLLVGDNLGLWQHRIETNNLKMLQPIVIKLLQKLLTGYPNWEILIALGKYGGLVIRDDEIIDCLRREALPQEFQTLEYEGSRRQGSRFGDIMYSASGPF